MNLRDSIFMAAAQAIDVLHSIIPDEGEAEISIIVSHKGQVQDSIVLGDHDLKQLVAVVVHVERSDCEVLDASSDLVVSHGIQRGVTTQ